MAAAWAVLDAVIDGSERVVDGLGDELERIQAAVFQDDQDQSEPIYLQLRDAGRLARAMHPDAHDLRPTRAGRARRGASRRCHRSSVTSATTPAACPRR